MCGERVINRPTSLKFSHISERDPMTFQDIMPPAQDMPTVGPATLLCQVLRLENSLFDHFITYTHDVNYHNHGMF